MKLQLTRPIVFLDIEATGLNTEEDRIVELSFCKLFPDGTREVKTNRYNPGVSIPAESTAIHGITDYDVKDKPLFKQHAVGILDYLHGCDLAGYNSNRYDVPMLYAELRRANVILEYEKVNLVDVGNIFKIKEERTLSAAVKFYCGRVMENAHSAEADILETVDVFVAQLARYEDLPGTMKELALFSNYGSAILDLGGKFIRNDKGQIIFNFGKYRGQPAADHHDFLEWMVHKANFPPDTTKVAMAILYPMEEAELEDMERPDPDQAEIEF